MQYEQKSGGHSILIGSLLKLQKEALNHQNASDWLILKITGFIFLVCVKMLFYKNMKNCAVVTSEKVYLEHLPIPVWPIEVVLEMPLE